MHEEEEARPFIQGFVNQDMIIPVEGWTGGPVMEGQIMDDEWGQE